MSVSPRKNIVSEMKIIIATTYKALIPRLAPLKIIKSDNKIIDINPIALEFVKYILQEK